MSDKPESQAGESSSQQGGEGVPPQSQPVQGQPPVSGQAPYQGQPGVPPQGAPYQQPGQGEPYAGQPYSGQPYQQPGQSAPYQGQPYQGGMPSQGGAPYQGMPPQGSVPPQQPPQGQPAWQPHVPGQQPVKNHQTSSLVLGILSILAALLSPMLAFILGGIGLAFASSDRRNFGPQASRAGRICSIVGIVLGVVMWVASFMFLMNTVDPSAILNGAVPSGTPATSSSSPLF